MDKTLTLLLVILTIMFFSGCSVLDSAIGGVGSTHSAQFIIKTSSINTSGERNQLNSEDREVILNQVRAVAEDHDFVDKTLKIASEPRPIAYFETTPPWPCILKIYETEQQLSIELWQYYDKREKTPLFKEVETILTNEFMMRFSDRMDIKSESQLQ